MDQQLRGAPQLAALVLRLAIARREWTTALLTAGVGGVMTLGSGGDGLTNASICSLVVVATAIQCQFAIRWCTDRPMAWSSPVT